VRTYKLLLKSNKLFTAFADNKGASNSLLAARCLAHSSGDLADYKIKNRISGIANAVFVVNVRQAKSCRKT
jgi:hypothetical protein